MAALLILGAGFAVAYQVVYEQVDSIRADDKSQYESVLKEREQALEAVHASFQ